MKKNLLKENATRAEVEEYFELNNYNDFDFDEIETEVDFACYADGYQDADFFSLDKIGENYNLYIR